VPDTVDAAVFARRRRGVMELMGEGVAVIPTAPVAHRNGDVTYPFRPDSDFYYLTHFPEPEAVAVLAPGRAQGQFLLFCREKDPDKEIWDGRRAGLDGAVSTYGADDAFPIDDIDEILPGLLENRHKVFCNMGRYADFDARLIGWLNEVKAKSRSGISAPGELVDLNYILHEMRLVKRVEELRLMRRAARVSVAAHRRAMSACRPGLREYQIEAELEYAFRRGGAHSPAYPSIVASGANACILHYTQNSDELADGDLLLIDAGAEIDCYASDVTRTFPVNGRFSAEQRAVYDIVLAAQRAAIDAARAGTDWIKPHDTATRVLTEGMVELGLLSGSVDGLIESGAHRRFYMHRTSHWLGMDVHDVGDYKIDDQWRQLEAGMVMTIEPGMYIAAADDVDRRWHGIGIRIEDDVVIAREGPPEVLSEDAPKSPEDIESLMAASRAGAAG
jgi:Xaa-Pro aminopeptidase